MEQPHKTPPEDIRWDAPRRPPPRVDWDPLDPPPRPRRGGPDLAPLFLLLDGLRRALPRDLQEQFTALVRELLLALRALIDWYLERLDGRRRDVRVEDIPID
jgi:hypothetical protein